jgi:hypothetical protein
VKTSPARILPFLLLTVVGVSGSAAQEPPPATSPEQTPAPPTRGGIRQPPPPLPKIPDVRQPGESGFWLGINAWFPTQEPVLDKGRGATFTQATRSNLPGKPKYAQGAEIGVAAGAHNSVRVSYFADSASGSFTNATELLIWTQDYTAGNFVVADYRLQNAKVYFDYLTWPFPVERRRFRLRTLWGVQYTSIRTRYNLPLLPVVDSSGNALTDSSGNALDYHTNGSHSFITPDLGLGVTQYLSPHIRLEANASGFTIPRHTTVWDADASLNLRSGHFELRVGAKAFHFKTSTQAEFYTRGTQGSGFVGLRWYSR